MKRWLCALAVIAAYPLITAAGGGAGCATTGEPKVEVVKVMVPVAAPCPDKRNPPPQFVDTLENIRAKTMEGADAVLALVLGGREQRIQYHEESDKQIAACAAPNPSAS